MRNSHAKKRVRLTMKIGLTSEIFVESTVGHAIAYKVYTKSHVQVSPHLVEGVVLNEMMAVRIGGCVL